MKNKLLLLFIVIFNIEVFLLYVITWLHTDNSSKYISYQGFGETSYSDRSVFVILFIVAQAVVIMVSTMFYFSMNQWYRPENGSKKSVFLQFSTISILMYIFYIFGFAYILSSSHVRIVGIFGVFFLLSTSSLILLANKVYKNLI